MKVLWVCLHLCEWVFCLTMMSYLWPCEVKRKKDEGWGWGWIKRVCVNEYCTECVRLYLPGPKNKLQTPDPRKSGKSTNIHVSSFCSNLWFYVLWLFWHTVCEGFIPVWTLGFNKSYMCISALKLLSVCINNLKFNFRFQCLIVQIFRFRPPQYIKAVHGNP